MPWISVQRLRVVISIRCVLPCGSAVTAGLSRRSFRSSSVHRSLHPAVSRRVLLVLFSPGPVHACVGVIFCLAGDGVAVTEQELLAGVTLEMVVAPHVDHRRAPSLRRGIAFAPMRKDFGAQFKPLVDLPFYQPSGVRKIAIVRLRNHLIAAATIEEPLTGVLLQPDGEFVPDFSGAESFVII